MCQDHPFKGIKLFLAFHPTGLSVSKPSVGRTNRLSVDESAELEDNVVVWFGVEFVPNVLSVLPYF